VHTGASKNKKALSKNAVPHFKVGFLAPKYWLTWLGIFCLSLYQWLPSFLKQAIANKLGYIYYQKNKKRRNIALTNIQLCFPDWSDEQYQQFTQQHFISTVSIMLDMPRLWWSSRVSLQKDIIVEGSEHIEQARKNNENIIFLTCHNLALEYGAIGLNFKLPIVGLVNQLRNPVMDWLISRARTRFNIQLAVKNDGIRSIIQAVKNKQAFYYLPDEDSGKERTIEAPFFAHKKQTLPVLGKLASISNATVIPCYCWFDVKQNKYIERCLAPMQFDNIKDEAQSTAQMNQILEELILIEPTQYMWTLRIFGKYKDDKR